MKLVVLRLISLLTGVVVCSAMLLAQNHQTDTLSTTSLKHRSLEELMDIDITIVAKSSQRWFEAPAAVVVISGDEIRRSGARSIPEALRLAPTLQVAQVDSRQWAINARGFNTTVANKLLVMIDGRSVYTALYAGVFWDAQDVLMEDIDRIEVISGPGGSVWGANAVNGVINIITRSAQDTREKPLLAQIGAGLQEKRSGEIQYGGTLSSHGSYRSYLKYFERGETKLESGSGAHDGWLGPQGGFRIDYDLSDHDAIQFQGDAYRHEADQLVNGITRFTGGNLLTKWSHTASDQSIFTLQSYFDVTHRSIPATFGEDLSVFDLDMAYQRAIADAHQLNLGLGFRHSNDRVVNSLALSFLPPRLQLREFSAFVEDMVSIGPDVTLRLGSKINRNDFTGFEFQPRLSAGWSRSHSEFLWASVSRAVRTPSRIDRDLYAPGVPPYVIDGGAGFKSEEVVALEGGYRLQASENILFDLALFYNFYDNLRSLEPGPSTVLKNGLEAKTFGGEMTISANISESWRVKVGYNHLEKELRLKPWSMDASRGSGEGNDPRHRVFIQSLLNVLDSWEVDCWLRYVDKLPNVNATVPAYTALDCHLGWTVTESLRFSLLIQNVLDAHHAEFGSISTRKVLGREVFGSLSVIL